MERHRLTVTSTYQYMIDVYETCAASALAAVTVLRYCAAGGMTIAGTPLYENLGIHWTLTIMGSISALLVPVPYIFYFYGEQIRSHSEFAQDSVQMNAVQKRVMSRSTDL